MKMKNKYKIF